LRLHALTGDDAPRARAEETLRLYRDRMERFPAAFGMMLCAADQHLAGVRQIVLAGRRDDPGLRAFERALLEDYQPNGVVALADPSSPGVEKDIPVLAGKSPVAGRPAVYVCESGTCRPPVLSPADLRL